METASSNTLCCYNPSDNPTSLEAFSQLFLLRLITKQILTLTVQNKTHP